MKKNGSETKKIRVSLSAPPSAEKESHISLALKINRSDRDIREEFHVRTEVEGKRVEKRTDSGVVTFEFEPFDGYRAFWIHDEGRRYETSFPYGVHTRSDQTVSINTGDISSEMNYKGGPIINVEGPDSSMEKTEIVMELEMRPVRCPVPLTEIIDPVLADESDTAVAGDKDPAFRLHFRGQGGKHNFHLVIGSMLSIGKTPKFGWHFETMKATGYLVWKIRPNAEGGSEEIVLNNFTKTSLAIKQEQKEVHIKEKDTYTLPISEMEAKPFELTIGDTSVTCVLMKNDLDIHYLQATLTISRLLPRSRRHIFLWIPYGKYRLIETLRNKPSPVSVFPYATSQGSPNLYLTYDIGNVIRAETDIPYEETEQEQDQQQFVLPPLKETFTPHTTWTFNDREIDIAPMTLPWVLGRHEPGKVINYAIIRDESAGKYALNAYPYLSRKHIQIILEKDENGREVLKIQNIGSAALRIGSESGDDIGKEPVPLQYKTLHRIGHNGILKFIPTLLREKVPASRALPPSGEKEFTTLLLKMQECQYSPLSGRNIYIPIYGLVSGMISGQPNDKVFILFFMENNYKIEVLEKDVKLNEAPLPVGTLHPLTPADIIHYAHGSLRYVG